jgi:CheY-like chemotaxis protein
MKTLLYIDDCEADIELLRLQLSQQAIALEGALSGRAGIAAYAPDRHHAIAIDWNLPDLGGPQVARALQARNPDCRIAFLSGALDDRHRQTAAQLGIHACFEKSLDMDHLRALGAFIHGSERI